MPNRLNHYNFSTLHRLYITLHWWILVLLLISVDWYKHSNTNVAGSKCILKRYRCINLKTKRDILSKCPHYIMAYRINLGDMCILLTLGLCLAYIDCSSCQIWSVYMQYLRRCDHSNNCLFLVIRQAEVLLNFFGVCIGYLCGKMGSYLVCKMNVVILSCKIARTSGKVTGRHLNRAVTAFHQIRNGECLLTWI